MWRYCTEASQKQSYIIIMMIKIFYLLFSIFIGCIMARDPACCQEIVTGPCRGYFPRYAYNKTSGCCQQFIYGGCGGNSNNYETKAECEKACYY